jgi:Methyltransferase domain
MPHWFIKSATHRVISWLPNPQSWNYLLQKYVTKTTTINKGGFEFKVERARRILENYREFSPQPREDFSVFELGTGWYPIIPIAIYLCGASKVWTVDIVALLRPEAMRTTLRFFCEAADHDELPRLLPGVLADRVVRLKELLQDKALRTPQQILAALNIEAVLMDARHTPLLPGSIDLIFSMNVLTHVPEDVVPDIFQEFARLASPGAVTVHSILMSDHYVRFDHNISDFNFLKYSKKAWHYLNSPVEYQSRYRVTDYRRLQEVSGFRIVREDNTRGSRADLESVKLDAEFRMYPVEDLLVTHTWMISVRK